MMRFLISGLILTTCVGQMTGGSSSCCDSRLESCQKLIQECMLSTMGSDITRCQSLACRLESTFTPIPSTLPDFTPFKPSPTSGNTNGDTIGDIIGNETSDRCCDGTTESCKMSISMCLATTGNPSMCERIACPSPGASPYPTPQQCCDGRMPGCQLSYQGCMNSTRNADMCAMIICPVEGSTPAPTKQPINQCCDGSSVTCQLAVRECLASGQPESICMRLICPVTDATQAPTRPPIPSFEAPSRPPLPSVEAPSRPPLPSVEAPSRPPLPSVEAPSRPPLPSVEAPSRPPLPSVEAPSKRPIPSIAITQRPTPSAFPTMFIKPLFSLMPSKLPKKSAAPTNFVMPERMLAAITFPKANLTMFKKPEKIQEIQAKLACALRLPLEKIEIRNITIQRATGKLEALDIDVSVARLSSNGTIKCLIFSEDSTPQSTPRSLRQLQGAQDSIVVSYDIVSPPEEIATSSANDLNTAITGDISMMAFANSVGSSGLSAEVSTPSVISSNMGATGATAPVGSSGPNAMAVQSQSSNTLGVGIGVGGGAVAIIAIGIVLTMYQIKKRKRLQKAIQSTPPVDIVRMNPVRANSVNSTRVMFTPNQSRV